jgi:ankyrin repeat protein
MQRTLLAACGCAALACVAASDDAQAPATTDPKVAEFLDAIGLDKVDVVKSMLSGGGAASLANAGNEYNETPLHISAIKANLEVIDLLLAAGANPNAHTDGNYPGHKLPVQRTPLMWLVYPCYTDAMKKVVAAGADPNFINEEGKTVLDIAIGQGEPCVQVRADLLSAGAKTAAELGHTALPADGEL